MIKYEVCALGGLYFPIPHCYCFGEYIDIPDNKINDSLVGSVSKIRGDAGSITTKRTHVWGANEGIVFEPFLTQLLQNGPDTVIHIGEHCREDTSLDVFDLSKLFHVRVGPLKKAVYGVVRNKEEKGLSACLSIKETDSLVMASVKYSVSRTGWPSW